MGWDCAWAVGRLAGWHAAMGPRYRRWKRAPPLRLPNLSLPGGPWPLLGWHCGEDDVVLNFTHPSAGEHHDPSPRTRPRPESGPYHRSARRPPIGTCIGAARGAVTGAAAGSIGGLVGTAVGGGRWARWSAVWLARAAPKRSTPQMKTPIGAMPMAGSRTTQMLTPMKTMHLPIATATRA